MNPCSNADTKLGSAAFLWVAAGKCTNRVDRTSALSLVSSSRTASNRFCRNDAHRLIREAFSFGWRKIEFDLHTREGRNCTVVIVDVEEASIPEIQQDKAESADLRITMYSADHTVSLFVGTHTDRCEPVLYTCFLSCPNYGRGRGPCCWWATSRCSTHLRSQLLAATNRTTRYILERAANYQLLSDVVLKNSFCE